MPPSVTLQEVKDATAADEALQSLAKVITAQRWHKVGKDVSQYQHIKQELSVPNGVILRGTRIIVPEKLRNQMIMLAHTRHQGIVKQSVFCETQSGFQGWVEWWRKQTKGVYHVKLQIMIQSQQQNLYKCLRFF